MKSKFNSESGWIHEVGRRDQGLIGRGSTLQHRRQGRLSPKGRPSPPANSYWTGATICRSVAPRGALLGCDAKCARVTSSECASHPPHVSRCPQLRNWVWIIPFIHSLPPPSFHPREGGPTQVLDSLGHHLPSVRGFIVFYLPTRMQVHRGRGPTESRSQHV